MTCRGQGATGICGERLGVMPHICHRTKQPPPQRIVASKVSVMWVERACLSLRSWAQRYAGLYSAFQFTWGRRLTSLSLSFRSWKVKTWYLLYVHVVNRFGYMVSCQLLLSPPVTSSMSQILECKVWWVLFKWPAFFGFFAKFPHWRGIHVSLRSPATAQRDHLEAVVSHVFSNYACFWLPYSDINEQNNSGFRTEHFVAGLQTFRGPCLWSKDCL